MNLSEQLKRDEGLRLTCYVDTVGKVTIGYGRNLSDKGISEAEADAMLEADMAEAYRVVNKYLPWSTSLDEPRRAVLVNMAFNMGIQGLMGFRNTLEWAQAGQFELAANGMLSSKWAAQVKQRATRLAEQMRSGVWQ